MRPRRLADVGVAIELIADLAGYADIRATKRYIHTTDQRRQQAINDVFDAGRSDWAKAEE